MSNELQTTENVSVGLTTISGFELAQRAAKMLSSSTLVPKDYQGAAGLPNCIIALNMANRMGADPLMIMQNLVVVHGRPTWSSQFLIATFNSCGRFTAMRFEFFGEKGTDSYGCRATATEKSTGEKLTGTDVTIGIAKAEGWYGRNGSKWKTMEQQMLTYRAASWFVRTIAPELSMGLHTQDEIVDISGDSGYAVVDSQSSGIVIDYESGSIIETAADVISKINAALSINDLAAIKSKADKFEGDVRKAVIKAYKEKKKSLDESVVTTQPEPDTRIDAYLNAMHDTTDLDALNEVWLKIPDELGENPVLVEKYQAMANGFGG